MATEQGVSFLSHDSRIEPLWMGIARICKVSNLKLGKYTSQYSSFGSVSIEISRGVGGKRWIDVVFDKVPRYLLFSILPIFTALR